MLACREHVVLHRAREDAQIARLEDDELLKAFHESGESGTEIQSRETRAAAPAERLITCAVRYRNITCLIRSIS